MNMPETPKVLMTEGAITQVLEHIRFTMELMKTPELTKLIEDLEALKARAFQQLVNRQTANPRCYCPDCGADLGNFYSNRIRKDPER